MTKRPEALEPKAGDAPPAFGGASLQPLPVAQRRIIYRQIDLPEDERRRRLAEALRVLLDPDGAGDEQTEV
jgi:hypothetical protein